MAVGWTEEVSTRKRAREKELDEEKRSSPEWKTEREKERGGENDQEEARTPAICHSDLTYEVSSTYLIFRL